MYSSFRLVVLVPDPELDLAGEIAGRNASSTFTFAERRLEARDVSLDLVVSLVLDRAVADHALGRRPPGRARCRPAPPTHSIRDHMLCLARALPGLAERLVGRRDAIQALDDVAQEARLRDLAVADDVEADVGLPLDALVDRFRDLAVEFLRSWGLAGDLCADQLEQFGRSRQAAGVCGDDAAWCCASCSSSRFFMPSRLALDLAARLSKAAMIRHRPRPQAARKPRNASPPPLSAASKRLRKAGLLLRWVEGAGAKLTHSGANTRHGVSAGPGI